MYVVMATMDGNTDVETLLAAIHLERYLKTFRQAGFLLARDLSHLDNGALIQLGVTATGHRKRILRLVQHIQRATNQNQSIPEPLEPLLDRCQSESDINSTPIQSGGPRSDQGGGTGDIPFEAFWNSSVPNIPSMLMNSRSEQQQYNGNVVIKPVPKPRTVFYIHKTEPARFLSCPASPTPPDPLVLTLTRKPSQESLSFTIFEGLASGEFNTDTVVVGPAPNPAPNPTPTPALRHSLSLRERRLSNSSDSGGPLPPVPPRLNRGTPPAMFRGPTSTTPSSGGRTEQNQDQCMTTTPPSSPCNYDDTGFPSSTTSPPGSPMEMVSNEIYCGTSPGTAASSGRIPCSAPQTPPRPEIHTSPERKSTLSNNSCESSHGVPMEDPEEEISPYCETVFQTRRPLQHSEAERTNSEGKTGMTRKEEAKHREDHGTPKLSWAQRLSHALHSESQGYSTVGEAAPPPRCLSLPPNLYPSEPDEDQTISPYASYTSLSEQTEPIICGWLDKLSPQGNYVFQKRYVKFDGKNLLYFGSEKDPYPKGVIPLAAIQMARMAKDNKFEIVTSHRTFVFRADNEVQRHQWCSTLQGRVKEQLVFGRPRFGPGSHCQRSGPLELKGTKAKIYVAINTEQVWLYKTEQCFRNGIGITLIEARGATIRDGKGKSFDLITPYKTFSFTAESERDKRDWMEAVQESIAETLSDYEVAEKIWSNRFNKLCADCQAVNPDWASINLCVVICKNCAGQHRGLGTMVSKVQSLKLDTSVWSNEIVQLFIMLGNDRANEFWAARLSPADGLDCDATPDQRKEFIIQKYREGRYRHPHPNFNTQEELLKVLCTAVTQQNLLKTVTQIFTEAEAVRSRLAASNGYDKHLSQEYSRSQDTSDHSVYDEIMQAVLHSGYLYKSASMNKGTLSRKTREDFQKYWCTVERSLLFYESDRCPDPSMKINVKDIVCLGVSRPDSCNNNGFIDRFLYTFQLYLSSEKLYQFGLETPDALQCWVKAIGKAATPLSCHCLLAREFERVGVLRYKAMRDPSQWKVGYFVLQKSNLFICPGNDGAAEDIINLKRLQELSIVTENQNHEKKEILVLVEKGRTLHLQGMGRLDFSLWYADIQRAAGGKGNTLREQQLSRNDIPIIVDSCIAFITQYGLGHEGIYRKNGATSRIKLLMEEFRNDARNVKLRIGDNFIEDVTDVLKRFFREIDDPIFMADLHQLWKEAVRTAKDKNQRLDRYKEIIRSLPRVNRTTLAALISHLYRVQKCADLNQMCTKNLSLLFAPSLFQTDGKGEHEVKIVEDLIDNYLYVFDIDEEQQTQIELELSLITTWKDTQLSQAGDLIIEVYLEKKMADSCITLKVSPTMGAEELTNQVLYMRNVPAGEKDVWLTFEAIYEGQLERPLHPKEKVLEQALQWCKMADPSSAYLVVKRVPRGEGINILTAYKSEIMKMGVLKCREDPPKLLHGKVFQEHTFQIKDHKLLLLRDKKSIKPEKEWPLKSMKIYMGIRKKLKPPTRWGFTLMMEKQQLYLCCFCESDLWDWVTNFLKAQNDDPRPPVLRRHSSSDISKQKFGTMPLIPIRGDGHESNSTMLSANQTLRKLHARRTLSMFFPMKVQQDSFSERPERTEPEPPEPLYEEVGDFGLQVLKSLETSFLSNNTSETQVPDGPMSLSLGPRKTCSLDRMIGLNPVHSLGPGGEGLLPPAGSLDTLVLGGGGDLQESPQPAPRRRQQHRPCTPSQELLLQELSSVFTKKTEKEEKLPGEKNVI
ncbi:arf-GAP with Rho-GAP domain, ANK repeat and PH domain-containing protein 3 isoform X1 [Oncorhynchus mykiss]|uniref:ArfGAP with RhoGAP domain, ankyrin repeat and PH domain 3 n=1 Tax=Oncorhynchus mykiss TaxID=8022 RepID=A0A8K9XUM5_ONCMY|nr:arf-GAP with Rho-GAP domain, ANK repeat and PH domain-containing protein 3 isoform X1 [Oncorhynchus mykiss]XP_036799326.1 arf-GAP with Rho-GAP domain, ANK repeat and PH domain-containing protein 3 isoform X1 [Oncorhynchus mykiss]